MSNDMNMMTSMAISKATRTDLGVSQSQAQLLSNGQDAAKKEQELRKASQGFEAIFLQQMWEEMRASMPENSLHGSKEEEYWQSMYSQQLGEDMAANGGIGLADMMMEQLTRNRFKSSNAAGVFNRSPMMVNPAPLLNEPTKQELEVKEAAKAISQNAPLNTSQNISSAHAQAPQDYSKNANNLYQSMETGMEAGVENNGANFAVSDKSGDIGQKNSPVINPNMNNTGQIEHDYRAESYTDANSVTNTNVGMNTVPQASPALRQTLDDLKNLAQPENAEPTIIRTTYTSNLPASERKNAILDKNGKITAKHLESLQPKVDTQNPRTIMFGNRERTMQNPINKGMNTQDVDSYPADLLAAQSNQAADNANVKNNEKDIKLDLLAGIQTRYVSNGDVFTLEDMEKIISRLTSNPSASPSSSPSNSPSGNAFGNVRAFPSYSEVQTELNTLLARDTNSKGYSAMLANSTQINTSNSFNPMATNTVKNENLVLASSPNMDRFLNNNASGNNISGNKSSIPVFRTMPSLDEALQAGTLIASLSPEEIRATQQGEKNPRNITPIVNLKKENQEKNAAALGGPQISQPLYVLPNTKISGISPELKMQAPLENGELRSGFGWRLDPFSKERAWHTGLDIQASAGSNVSVAHDGIVSFAGKDAELGNMIIVEHGNGMQSIYGHNAELLVKEGEKISAGTNIAKVGMSGRAAGAHLHFEIRHNGLSINPEPYLSRIKA